MPNAQDAAQSVQRLAEEVIRGLGAMPKMRVHLDACHAHLTKTGKKPTGGQADTLAALKLVADFQDKAAALLDEVQTRAALAGAEEVRELNHLEREELT